MQYPPEGRQAPAAGFTGRAAVVMRRAVTAVVFIIAGLTFCFGFGNGYAVGVQLGVPGWIAPLVAPSIDLSVVALLASMQYLRTNGYDGRLLGPRLLLLFSGTATLAMNTAHPIIIGAYGQACFYAVAPLLLIGWSEVGPRLLASMHGTTAEPSPAVPDDQAGADAELVARARQLDAEHREQHGRPITRDKLRAALKVSNAVASDVLRSIRTLRKD
ncbi:hypothetical protein LWC34_43150 [Kibdelosporangium philippinense]|uniref:DUF2637 domain-containing protein n=1 Tax=Kibdelosporangium philippinense TaxID=211113 RepID=A0ABS8ZP80_9PSEU|nr:hypothetical protein [Kibdelosporangium philippinense]MCE7009561.1 hypothetical protein [Kibdelosporangium philippinense]